MIVQCEVCKTKVETKIYWRKFCSDKCRLISWAKKQPIKAEKKK